MSLCGSDDDEVALAVPMEPAVHEWIEVDGQRIRKECLVDHDQSSVINAPETASFDANPIDGAEIYVHYEVFDEEGVIHDSSREREYPFHFTLGASHAAPLWAAAIRSMIPGDKAVFHCRSEHIYNQGKRPPNIVSPDTPLRTHVELLYWDEWSNVVYDGRVRKKKLQVGTMEVATPNDGSVVIVKYTGRLMDGTVFEEEKVTELTICKSEMMEGFELAIKSMCTGERSLFRIDPSYGLGVVGDSQRGIPPNAMIEYDVELVSYILGTLKWEMKAALKVEFAHCRKEHGNTAFRLGQLERAEHMYNQSLEMMQYEGEEKEAIIGAEPIKIAVLNNLAAIKLKQALYDEAITLCSKVLRLDPDNLKALYRRAQCYMSSTQPDLALKDAERALQLEPTNTIMAAMKAKAKQWLAKAERKQVKQFGGWCDRANVTMEQDAQPVWDPNEGYTGGAPDVKSSNGSPTSPTESTEEPRSS